MEKKTEVKENHNREDQHYTETWYRDQLKLGHTCRLPHSFNSPKYKDARELVYKEFARSQRNKKILNVVAMSMVIISISYLIFSFGFRS
ncbi:hypothetical protein CMI37_24070 [Candidatus Pacearchaeota archaeon]|nr:hypothetical protein [Candidatus Pacearchaeota archaeon]